MVVLVYCRISGRNADFDQRAGFDDPARCLPNPFWFLWFLFKPKALLPSRFNFPLFRQPWEKPEVLIRPTATQEPGLCVKMTCAGMGAGNPAAASVSLIVRLPSK